MSARITAANAVNPLVTSTIAIAITQNKADNSSSPDTTAHISASTKLPIENETVNIIAIGHMSHLFQSIL